jgi:hypothetical protein
MLSIRVIRCALSLAAILALSLLSSYATRAGGTVEVGEEALAILYRTIGENQSIRQAIEAAFGQANPETARLLGLSSDALGQHMIRDPSLALRVLSGGSLSASQQDALAATINSGRLTSPVLAGRTAAEEPLLALPKTGTRVWTLKPPSAFNGWSDVSLDPPVTIPLVTIKQNRVQIVVDTIPIGKPAAAAAAAGCVTISGLDQNRIADLRKTIRDLLSHPNAFAAPPSANPTQSWRPTLCGDTTENSRPVLGR